MSPSFPLNYLSLSLLSLYGLLFPLSVLRDTSDEIIQITKSEGGAAKSEKISSNSKTDEQRCIMKGYYTETGYMGHVNNQYVLFSSEADYLEFMED